MFRKREAAFVPGYKLQGASHYLAKKAGDRDSYTGSKHWEKTRKKKFEHSRRKCRLCNATKYLVVHHRSYENLGREDIKKDLVIVCGPGPGSRNCHREIHWDEQGRKTPLNRTALVARENYLYRRNRNIGYRVGKLKPSDILSATGKVIKALW